MHSALLPVHGAAAPAVHGVEGRHGCSAELLSRSGSPSASWGLGFKIRTRGSDVRDGRPLLTATAALAAAQALERAEAHLPELRGVFAELAAIMADRPGQFYRYHDHWRHQTQTAVFLLAFIGWLRTGSLHSHQELQERLGCVCSVSNEMPRYVVNQVTAGDYDCPRRVSSFLSELFAAFRLLNLRNDFLRKRFDGLKYDLKRVEEVLYDVKIRGLLEQKDGTVEMF
eukprot:SM000076S21825  [mRNA]  locus=s76:431367:433629:+ [translate_table: standard]